MILLNESWYLWECALNDIIKMRSGIISECALNDIIKMRAGICLNAL